MKKFALIYKELIEKSDPVIGGKIVELIEILSLVKKHIGLDNWEEPSGGFNLIAPHGFDGVEIHTLLPPARIKGAYFEMIERGSLDIANEENVNKLSMAFSIRYRNKEIILGGDGSVSLWNEQQKFCKRASVSLTAHAVKLPHHGSDKDNSDNILCHLFGDRDDNIAVISANGCTHPSLHTLDRLERNSIKPYCTNLSGKCTPIRTLDMRPFKHVDPELGRFLYSNKTSHQLTQADLMCARTGVYSHLQK